MDKSTSAAYLADLITIMEFHERMGTTKNPLIVAEFASTHDKLIELLKKDQARKS